MRCRKHYHRQLQRQSIFFSIARLQIQICTPKKRKTERNVYKYINMLRLFVSKIRTYPCSFKSINFKVIWVGQQLLLLLQSQDIMTKILNSVPVPAPAPFAFLFNCHLALPRCLFAVYDKSRLWPFTFYIAKYFCVND